MLPLLKLALSTALVSNALALYSFELALKVFGKINGAPFYSWLPFTVQVSWNLEVVFPRAAPDCSRLGKTSLYFRWPLLLIRLFWVCLKTLNKWWSTHYRRHMLLTHCCIGVLLRTLSRNQSRHFTRAFHLFVNTMTKLRKGLLCQSKTWWALPASILKKGLSE